MKALTTVFATLARLVAVVLEHPFMVRLTYPMTVLALQLAVTQAGGWHAFHVFMWAWLLVEMVLAALDANTCEFGIEGFYAFLRMPLVIAAVYLGIRLLDPMIGAQLDASILGSVLTWSWYIARGAYILLAIVALPAGIRWLFATIAEYSPVTRCVNGAIDRWAERGMEDHL